MLLLFLSCTGAIVAFMPRGLWSASAVGADDLSSLSFHPNPGARLPLAEKLVDESGRPVALGSYFTKSPVILVLEYLRCTSLCGVTLRHLIADALNRLPLVPGRDYQLVAISIDPRDKPADAAAARSKYAALFDHSRGRAGVHFLTGSLSSVKEIADTVGFPYRYDKLFDAYIHPAGFIVAAPDGVISRYIEGVAFAPDTLIDAIAAAEQDKSQGPLTRLLLLCHVQGAPLGRLTIPVLAAFILADIVAGFAAIAIFTGVWRRHG
ncbi:MAG TPA: SCO family protein [Pseudolabrys sp.]|nr:SCO family protein [Pseudolabrys sp.]